MEIIKFKDEDYDEVYSLLQLLDEDFYPRIAERCSLQDYFKGVVDEGKILCIKDNSKIVGFIGYFFYDKEFDGPYITFIGVMREYRGKKLGKLLMDECLKDLRANDVGFVRVQTWSTNESSNILYKKLGFKVYNTIKDDRSPGVDTVQYELKL